MKALIFNSGIGKRMMELTQNNPKSMVHLYNDETIFERQIRLLQEAGINDITVVVGYKQELYFFLVDKWGVNLEINTDLKKNNIFSLYMAE